MHVTHFGRVCYVPLTLSVWHYYVYVLYIKTQFMQIHMKIDAYAAKIIMHSWVLQRNITEPYFGDQCECNHFGSCGGITEDGELCSGATTQTHLHSHISTCTHMKYLTPLLSTHTLS